MGYTKESLGKCGRNFRNGMNDLDDPRPKSYSIGRPPVRICPQLIRYILLSTQPQLNRYLNLIPMSTYRIWYLYQILLSTQPQMIRYLKLTLSEGRGCMKERLID